jgi:hypothetical protein
VRKSYLLLLKEQSGVAMLLVAFCMFMIIGFTALVVDVGGLYLEKSLLQKALDAAVLGGAQELKISKDDASNEAIKLAEKNGFIVSENEVTTGTDFIDIQKTVTKDLTFARILGFSQTDISASARAETVQTLLKGDGVIPVAFERKVLESAGFGEQYLMHSKPGKNIRGNFGFLAIDGRGANILGDGITNGSKTPVEVGNSVETEPGLNWGKVREGFQDRITKDKGKLNCSSYQTADKTCKRIVTVPIIESWDDAHGRSGVKIIGFAAFWVEKVEPNGNDKAVIGRFIEFVSGGTFGPGEHFGIYGIKLVN